MMANGPAFAMPIIDGGDMMDKAAAYATGEVAEILEEFATQYYNLLNANRQRFEAANKRAVEWAQEAMVDAYETRINQNRISGYRSNAPGVWKRYSGGVLEQALASPRNIVYDEESVGMVNRRHMDRQAKQWYRLNFGTTNSMSDFGARPAPVTFFGVTVGTMSLDNMPGSKPFRIPRGFWVTGGAKPVAPDWDRQGEDAFAPAKYVRLSGPDAAAARRVMMKPRWGSVGAYRFIDEGLAVLAREFPRGQQDIIQDIGEDSANRIRRIHFGDGRRDFIRVKTFRRAFGRTKLGESGLLSYAGW